MLTLDKVYEITDMLERKANDELNKATAYHEGYIQACEDFGREIRLKLIEEQVEED